MSDKPSEFKLFTADTVPVVCVFVFADDDRIVETKANAEYPLSDRVG